MERMWKASLSGLLFHSFSKRGPKCSQGDPPVIFQGIEDQAAEPERGHINILALTHIINSSAINMIPHILTLTHTLLC